MGNAADEVLLVGGDSSSAGVPPCTQAVEVITPNPANPSGSAIRYWGRTPSPSDYGTTAARAFRGRGTSS